jgi:hypothetical protein
LRWAISAPNIVAVAAANIRVAIKIVVVIDIYVVVAPAAAPAPTTAPERSHHHTKAERNRQPGGVVSCRVVNRRVGIQGRTPDHHGVIRRHIHNLGIRLFDYDHAFVLDDSRFHPLLFCRFQVPVVLGFFSHSLHGIHDITLLGEEHIAQVSGPLNIVSQALHNIR